MVTELLVIKKNNDTKQPEKGYSRKFGDVNLAQQFRQT